MSDQLRKRIEGRLKGKSPEAKESSPAPKHQDAQKLVASWPRQKQLAIYSALVDTQGDGFEDAEDF